MKKKQAAEKPDRHKKKGKTKPGLTFVERRRLAELKHMLAGTNKNAEKPTTAQKTITFQKMYRDGICQVTSGFYTKMVEFYDINYKNVNIKIDIFSCFYRFAILHNTQPVLLYIFTFRQRSSKAATAASLSRSLYPLLCKLLYLFLE